MNNKLFIMFLMTLLLVGTVSAAATVPDFSGTIGRTATATLSQTATNGDNVQYDVTGSITALINTADNSFQIPQSSITVSVPATLAPLGSGTVDLGVTVPSAASPGTYQGTFTMNYQESANASNAFVETSTVTVTVTNEAPVIVSIADQPHTVGQEFTLTVSASDADDTSLTYTLTTAPSGMVISGAGAISGWTPTIAGTETVTVRVADAYTSDSETFVITSQADNAQLTIADATVSLGGENQNRGEQVQQTFTVTNTGTQTITGISPSFTSLSGGTLHSDFAAQAALSATTLTAGQSATVTVTMNVPLSKDSEPETVARLTLTGQGNSVQVTDTINVQMEARSYLAIDDVEITIDGNRENIDDGDNFDEIKEGDTIRIEVTLENLYSNSDDITIENAYFEIEADESDWDIEEDSSEEDIDADDKETFVLTFTIDDDIEDEETDVTIRAYGEDEEGNFDHYDEITFSFEIDRERNEITIISAELSSETVSCTARTVGLDVRIKNTGTDDQDEVTLEVVADELDWHQRITRIDLDDGDATTRSFNIPVDGVDEGTYFVDIETFYDNDDESDSETVVFTVSCNTNSNSNSNSGSSNGGTTTETNEQTGEVIVTTTGTTGTTGVVPNSGTVTYGQPVGSLENFRNSNAYTVLLIVGIVVLLGVISTLGMNLIKK